MLCTLLLSMWMSGVGLLQTAPDEDPLQIDENIRQFVADRISRSDDQLEQLRTLVRVVFQENALNFKYVNETRTAIETFSQRSGNCVSFTFLFLAMARHLGMSAHFREVAVIPTWSRIGNLVSMSGHVNIAVFIGGQHYVVDLFPEVNRIEIGGTVVSDERAFAHFLNNKAVDSLAAGHNDEAIACFDRALEHDPSMVRVWSNRGVAYKHMKQYDKAEKSYNKALQLDPADMVTMSNLASLYETLGRDKEARRFEDRAHKLQMKNPYYHYNLALEDYRSGSYTQCVEHLKTALRLKPVEHNFHMAMARAYAQLGEMDRVSECLKSALEDAPDNLARIRYNEKLALLASYVHSKR
jgi:Flp pilus assembly protein TadD